MGQWVRLVPAVLIVTQWAPRAQPAGGPCTTQTPAPQLPYSIPGQPTTAGPCGPMVLTTITTTTPAAARCSGHEEEWAQCSFLRPCSDCVPVDCKFAEWADWNQRGDCTSICVRNRAVQIHNNECGKPCNGTLSESKRCYDIVREQCSYNVGGKTDCQFGAWQMWHSCNGSSLSQKYRTRRINSYASDGGLPCKGPTNETQACGQPRNHTDCEFSLWSQWSSCSRSCDGGLQTRTRRVWKPPSHGGSPCKGSLSQASACETQRCLGNLSCVLGVWSHWSGCKVRLPPVVGLMQKSRSRTISQPLQGQGAACQGVTRQTETCGFYGLTCVLSDWHEWDACSVTCGSSQRYRTRHIQNPSNASQCPLARLTETEACNLDMCIPKGTVKLSGDCRFRAWNDWSQCSSKCGIGARYRTREIGSLAVKGKQGCIGVTKEVDECWGNPSTPQCGRIDCLWDAWQEWSACTTSCGGGEHRRNRVIKVSPLNGGRLCAIQDKAEIAICNTDPCNTQCINGKWGQWSDWSECSATCDDGVRSRSRKALRLANNCGVPNTGTGSDYQKCSSFPCEKKRDCQFTDWTDWSYCNSHCFGTRHRSREISVTAKGGGQSCLGSVKDLTPCSPAPGESTPAHCTNVRVKRNCQLSSWHHWTTCSTTCGGGQQQRSRRVSKQPLAAGKACNDALKQIKGCGTLTCPVRACRDCRWGSWSQWGSCTGCEGQKIRHRSIVQSPNFCGKRCVPSSGEETTKCTGECDATHYCSWSQWTPLSSCPKDGCGPHASTRHRSLMMFKQPPAFNDGTFYAKGPSSIRCFGMQGETRDCNLTACVPANSTPCIFAPWSDWAAPTCSGLCYRQRNVQQNSHLLPPCKGPIAEAKVCAKLCNKRVDCELNDWKPWTMCIGHHMQKYRSRRVIHYPKFGGMTCNGSHVLNETDFCQRAPVVMQNCNFSAWSIWNPCDKTCGSGGWQRRTRHINVPSGGGGLPCNGGMEQIRGCNEIPCPGDPWNSCSLNFWTAWSACRPYTSQKYRHRQPTPTQTCKADLKEIAPCASQNCTLSAWAAWDMCSVSCGGGHHRRSRSVISDALPGGRPCRENLAEIRPCGQAACDPCAPLQQPCVVSAWTDWQNCSALCGNGFQARSRSIISTRSSTGAGCNMVLLQNRSCHLAKCPSPDCVWTDWIEWTQCSRTCGKGQQTRKRWILTPPGPGGRPCQPVQTEHVQPCNLSPCSPVCVPVDGEWSPWTDWGYCSSKCRGGLTWRTRMVAKEVSSCGKPVEGPDKEFKNCNADVSCSGDADCEFGQWELWSDCSATCDGVKRRSRHVVAMGRGKGAHCNGPLQESTSCHPGPEDDAPPSGCQPAPNRVDCAFSAWTQAACPVSCGGSSAMSGRHILTPMSGGGRPCIGPVLKLSPCGEAHCPGPTRAPCHWTDWDDWGACDRAGGGQRKRFRRIRYHPESDEVCPPGDSEETVGCNSERRLFCGWADWGDWGTCSKPCNLGARSRRRNLTELSSPPAPGLKEVLFPGQFGYSTPLPTTTVPNRHCHEDKCLESNGPDWDCCAKPSLASCAAGYLYSRGSVCWGTDFFKTCCLPDTQLPTTQGYETTTSAAFATSSTSVYGAYYGSSTTPTSTTLPISALKMSDYIQNNRTPADYGLLPGLYEIEATVAVTASMSSSSKMTSRLEASQVVDVTYVEADLQDQRIRGRVRAPLGWISIVNMRNGHHWAHPVSAQLQRKNEIHVLPKLMAKVQDPGLVASYFCGLLSLLSLILLARRFPYKCLPQRTSASNWPPDQHGDHWECTQLLRPELDVTST